MRIAIVTESFLPQVNGVTNSVERVVQHLRHRGHNALIVAPGPGPDAYCGAPVVHLPALDLPVVNSIPIGVPTRTVYTALRDFRPDVVHLAAPVVVGARGLVAARQLGIPTVAVYQTDVAGFAAAYGLGFAANAAWLWLGRLHRLADRTLAPSTDAMRQLRAHDIPRVHHWARGVDTERFSPTRRDSRLRAEIAPRGELIVGYVGRLAPEKQVDRLAALADAPGVQLVVIGGGPDLASLQRRIPSAMFLGPRYGDDLATAFASLDVFVHTGPHETFCQTVQEAMACGLPVLAPDAGGPRDLVHHGRTGYLLPAQRKRFAAALREGVDALRDEELRAAFGLAARESVLQRTWPALCDELIGHYQAVTGKQVGDRTWADRTAA